MKLLSPKTWSKGFKAFIVILVICVLVFALFSRDQDYSSENKTSSSNRGSKAAYDTAGAEPATEMAPEAPVPMPQADYEEEMSLRTTSKDESAANYTEQSKDKVDLQNRKIIMEGSAQLETKEFDKSINAIDQIIASSGGFAETRNIRGNGINRSDLRYATIVFRVPAEQFESIMDNMGSTGTVVQSNTNGTDITDQYVDSETRLKNLKVQEQTLLDILAKAEKLEDVITLESRLYEIRYQVESIENTLKNYDRLVQYSRISINISEVVEVTEKKPIARTLGDKISEAFNNAIDTFITGLEDFTIWLVANWILFVTMLFVILLFILFSLIHKRKKVKAEVVSEIEEKKD